MTVITTVYGYLEQNYLEEEYLTGQAYAAAGMQAQFTINDDTPYGMQVSFNILDYLNDNGMQADFVVSDEQAIGMQVFTYIDSDQSVGMQTEFVTSNLLDTGMQSEFIVSDELARAMEVRFDKALAHTVCGYLEGDYLEDAYLTECMKVNIGMQANFIVFDELDIGMQCEFHIVDREVETGMQTLFHIVDYLAPLGMQVDMVRITTNGMQCLVALYNTTNLRILCDFASRGSDITGGTNAWGNPIGEGENWMANTTEPGDFSVYNLNTDIVEQYWRSADTVVTGIQLDCDTEINQGVFLDTFAMLGHNLTKSATINLLGSNVSNFASVGISITIPQALENTYWLSPELPIAGYRYWRLQIDDPTNPDGYIKIGTLLFGAAKIFQGECFVDELEFTLKDFADSVKTEGFTNVANSRAQKRVLRLDFRFLDILKDNYGILREVFTNDRTVLKCLYIPTPDGDNDQDIIGRYSLFGKLTSVPTERHSNRGSIKENDANYASFTIEVDESM